MYPSTINNLIECYKKLPGIGSKTAERLALSTLKMDDEIINLFSTNIKQCKTSIKKCKICGHLTEQELCSICSDKNRDNKTICVVEDSKSVIIFEKIGTYSGMYHVLEGLISPLDGIEPDNLNIANLIERIQNNNIEEVIIAVKPSIEGETTALYISKLLENYSIKVTRIAHGIPIGVDMEYLDSLTLEMALEDRTNIS